VRILAIDPGYAILGWAIVEPEFRAVAYGAIETSSGTPLGDRLVVIQDSIDAVIREYNPACAAIEKIFFTNNTKTAMDVAKCIGVVILTLARCNLAVSEYTPSEIKQALTGYGKATKLQVQKMVAMLYRMQTLPTPDDTADALAIAACHSLSMNPVKNIHRQKGK
jgi:crossover junction endodeoxyribonuclease RuvC